MDTTHVASYLREKGWNGQIHEFAESSATVELAAEKLGTEPKRIAKTLGFYHPEDPTRALIVVTAGDAKVNGGMFKRTFGGKPRMLQRDDVHAFTGHPVGGVCPFAMVDSAHIYLDESLRRFETVFPAAGTTHSAIEMTPDELERVSSALGWVDVATAWRDEE